jgi:hypothetical protein
MRPSIIARELGLEAYGSFSDLHTYGRLWSAMRQRMAARNKDFWKAKYLKPTHFFSEPYRVREGGATGYK